MAFTNNFIFRFILVLGIAASSVCYSQQIVSGSVTDQCGNPVAHATILFKNSAVSGSKAWRTGTATSTNGTYRLMLYDPTDSVKLTHINYKEQKLKFDGNNIVNFKVEIRRDDPLTISKKANAASPAKSKTEKYDSSKNPRMIFTKVEIEAGFPKGNEAFLKYLDDAIAYSSSGISGTVKVGFTIDRDGYIKNATLIKGLSEDQDQAVLNAILKSPKWLAAMQNGRYVEQYKEVEVAF
jgi:hypothetical protein